MIAHNKASLTDKGIDALLALMRTRQAFLAAHTGKCQSAASRNVKLREAQFSDFAAVAELKTRFGLSGDTLENWYRLWRDNPAIARAKSPLSMGHVLEAQGRVVGYHGSIPVLYRYKDRDLLAATGTGLVVEPAYRAHAMELVGAFYRQKQPDLLLVTTAVESLAQLSKVFRAKPLAQADYHCVLFFILKIREFVRAAVSKLGVFNGLEGAATAFAALGVAAENTLRRRGLRGLGPSDVDIREIAVPDIGDEFAALWQMQTKQIRLLADRSPAALRWHFTAPANHAASMVLCCRWRGRLLGYAIVQHSVDAQCGLKKACLADLLVENDDPHATECLLSAAYSHAQLWGDHVFEVLGFPQSVRTVVLRWKPYVRKYPACPFFYKTQDKELQRMLMNDGIWYATPFDGDTTLMPR